MTITNDLQDMEGRIAVDATGAKLGKIRQVYVDSRTGEPLWVTISTGMFGTKQNFAPLYGCQSDGDNLRLAVTKEMVKGAPGIEDDESEALCMYYGGYAGGSADKENTEAGRARLRNYVVTENVTRVVPVSREEARLERGPITDANRGAAASGSDIDDPDISR